MREILKMIVVLSVICAISGFSLSYLHQTTQPIIEAKVLDMVQAPAILAIFGKADNDPVVDRQYFESTSGKVAVFPYKQEGKLVGVAIEGFGKGYGGNLGMMVGFDMERETLLGVRTTEMRETVGIGTAVGQAKFTGQFAGSGLAVNLKSAGGNIDAISGATVSSGAAVVAVQNASGIFQELKAQIADTWK